MSCRVATSIKLRKVNAQMIRGVLIFGVGFGLGYAKAMHDMPDIQENLVTIIQLLKEEARVRQERAQTIKETDQQGETPS